MGDVKKIQKAARKGVFLLSYKLMDSKRFGALSGNALKVYFWVVAQYNGRNNGQLTAKYREISGQCFLKIHEVGKALKELKAAGFIRVTAECYGNGADGSILPSLYAITTPKLPIDWKTSKKRIINGYLGA